MQALHGQQQSKVFLWTSTHWSSAMTVCSTKGLLSPACNFSIRLTMFLSLLYRPTLRTFCRRQVRQIMFG